MLVVSKDLKLVNTLYGFDEHQVGPGQVVYIENMIHFAAQHPERLRLADLRTGETNELYPIKGDSLRAQFVELHAQHMPDKEDCQQNNDPCNPSIFDETIDFLPSDQAAGFRIRVTREGRDAVVEIPFQQADYNFQQRKNQWYYCSRELSAARLVKLDRSIPTPPAESCYPNLPVTADADAGQPSPFPASEKKVK